MAIVMAVAASLRGVISILQMRWPENQISNAVTGIRLLLPTSLVLVATLLAACTNPSDPRAQQQIVSQPLATEEPRSGIIVDPLYEIKRLVTIDVPFDFSRGTINPEGKATLDDLIGQLHCLEPEVIVAVGFTDSIGSDAYNQKLSFRRAEAVKTYLVNQKVLEPGKIYVQGRGSTKPVKPNNVNGKDNPSGRAKNRRVEVEAVALEQIDQPWRHVQRPAGCPSSSTSR